MKTEADFREALQNKKIPLLVLDQKWHRLFAIHGKTDEIKQYEAQINECLARQGKLTTEEKELRRLKKQLMDNIVQNMEGHGGNEALREKKQEENKRLIDEINEKLEACEDELLDIPKEIHENNVMLMLASMEYFYSKIRVNQQEAQEIDEWITQVRIDLKKNIIRKQNREINNREIYSYLHDIFGAEVINIFDIKYDDEEAVKDAES